MQHVYKSAVNKDGKENETGKSASQTASGRGWAWGSAELEEDFEERMKQYKLELSRI